MQNIETLKQELINQKAEIEAKGGSVEVAGLNPSPAEITEGIKTIIGADLSDATAKISDVLSGKTFYAGGRTKKMGTLTRADTQTATAKADDVAAGKTFFAGNDTIKTGNYIKPDYNLTTAEESDVIEGKTFYSKNNQLKTGSLIKLDVSVANALEGDVLAGKTFFAGDETLKTGSLTKADTASANATEKDVAAGKTFFAGNDELKTGKLEVIDPSNATATERDVKKGKTFYAGNNTLKTGTLEEGGSGGGSEEGVPIELFKDLFFYEYNKPPENVHSYKITIPDYINNVKAYQFYKVRHELEVDLHDHINVLGDFCFSDGYSTKVNNVENSNVKTLQQYCFKTVDMDVNSLPDTVTKFGDFCMLNCIVKRNTNVINMPNRDGVTYGAGVYKCNSQVYVDTLNFTSYWKYNYLPQSFFERIHFNCDFVVPENVTTVQQSFNSYGSFNHVTITKNVTSLGVFAFGGPAIGYEECIDFTFLGDVPPTFDLGCLPVNRAEMGLKIYVPDNSLDIYTKNLKTVANFTVLPLSQKP